MKSTDPERENQTAERIQKAVNVWLQDANLKDVLHGILIAHILQEFPRSDQVSPLHAALLLCHFNESEAFDELTQFFTGIINPILEEYIKE